MAVAGDLAQPEQARQLVRDVVSAWDRLDILVNNAGIWEEDVAGRGDLEVWDRTYAVNLRGAYLVTDAAVPHLIRHGGSIVFVSSTAGQRGEARHSAYAASKGALISYTKSLAEELGPRGVRVNCVAPGWVETDMAAGTLSQPGRRLEIEREIPLGRVASPSDIAGPILFLVSDLARHVQGEILNVNGGSVLAG
jgi:3-oxoacyl-[acyl-carrier protein] reductase